LDGQTPGHYLSFVLRIDEGAFESQFNGQIILSDGRRVELLAGSYLVRVWLGDEGDCVRGVIRNESTKERIRFQSGDRLASFIQSSMKGIGGQADDSLPGLIEGVNDGV
jgi:hypothetical protein